MWWVIRSPWGRAFTALRENPIRAESLGIDVRLYTLLAFAIGSAYGGFAGALYAPLVEFIDPNPFALGQSFLYLLMVVVGGAGYFAGPFVGAAVAVLLPEWLRFAEGYYLLIYATLVMVLLAVFPGGIVGLITRLFAGRRTAESLASGTAAPLSAARGDGAMTRVLEVENVSNISAASRRCAASPSVSRKARSSASSARTARANPLCSTASSASSLRPAAKCVSTAATSRDCALRR